MLFMKTGQWLHGRYVFAIIFAILPLFKYYIVSFLFYYLTNMFVYIALMIYPISVYEYELLYWHNFIVHCGSRAHFLNLKIFRFELSFHRHCYNYVSDGVMECIDAPYMTIMCLSTSRSWQNNEKTYKTKLQTTLRCNLTS